MSTVELAPIEVIATRLRKAVEAAELLEWRIEALREVAESQTLSKAAADTSHTLDELVWYLNDVEGSLY